MNVPLLDLKAQYRAIKADVDAAVAEVMESQHFILGPKVEQCEKAIAQFHFGQLECSRTSATTLDQYVINDTEYICARNTNRQERRRFYARANDDDSMAASFARWTSYERRELGTNDMLCSTKPGGR